MLQQITLPDLNGGLNTHDPEYDIADNQSPDILNLWYKNMTLCKRPGQTWLLKLGNVYRISGLYNEARAIHAGTKLYRLSTEGAKRYIGEFDPAVGYPIGADEGDYCIAGVQGTLHGVAYEAGDMSVYGGVQSVSVTVEGTVTAAGEAAVVVTARGISDALLALSVAVEVEEGDTSVDVAEKVRIAIAAETSVTALFSVGGTEGEVTLTQATAGLQDKTLSVSIDNGTCAGLTNAVSCDISVWRNAISQIGAGLQNGPGVFCEFGDLLYYIDGAEIWEIDANYTVEAVEPYVPVVMINAAPNLSSSDDNESYNLIGSGFTVKYNGDGSTKVFLLPQKELDSTEVSASVNAIDKTEGTHFSINRTTGTITFNTAPANGTNNVWITACKTVENNKAKITGCKTAVRFGGEAAGVVGGTRVFVMANPAHPCRYWCSDLGLHVSAGMRYFPDTAEEVLDQNNDAITAAAKMGDELIIFKENSLFAVGYSFDGEDVYYPVRECHSTVGCDMPGSVQLIDNRLVFAHSKGGVFMLASSNNDLENIVKPISANINSLLLKENSLKEVCSCDYERYYWLCVNGKAYLWDYDTTPYYNYADYDKAQKRLAWYRFDNISASEFIEDGGLCYTGVEGIVRFTKSRNDFGKPISAYFRSKAFDLGNPEDEKTFVALYPSFSMDGNIMATITVGNERTDAYKQMEFDIRSFDWNDFNWSAYTWNRIKYAKTYSMRLNMRKAGFLQVKVSGGEIDRGVGLSGLRITYYVGKKMKR